MTTSRRPPRRYKPGTLSRTPLGNSGNAAFSKEKSSASGAPATGPAPAQEAEVSLRATNARLRIALDAADLGIHEYRPATGELIWDQRCRRIFGVSESAPVNLDTFWRAVHPDDREATRVAVECALHPTGSATFYDVIYRVCPLDGSALRWVRATGRGVVQLLGSEQHIVQFVGSLQDITREKEAERVLREREEALRHSEAKFRALYDSNVVPIAFWHGDGRITEANDAYLALLRSSRAAVERGLVRWNEFEGGSANRTAAVVAGTEARVSSYETEYILADGGRIPVLVAGARLPGSEERGVCVAVDLSERMRSEMALKKEEERYRLATEAVNAVIFDWNLIGGTVERSAGLHAVVGYHPGEVPRAARWWQSRIHPDDLPVVKANFTKALRSKVPVHEAHYRVRHRDDTYRHVWERNRLVRDDNGALVRVVGSIIDVTARTEAENRLQESERRFSALLETMPQIVWVSSPDGVTDYLNSRWYEYTGTTRDKGTDYGWVDALHPDDQRGAKESWQRSLATGEWYEAAIRLRRHDGEYRWFLARSEPIRDVNRQIAHWLGTCTDIHHEVLAKEVLKDADRKKDEFLAMLAHELRNPLAAITNAAALARRLDTDREAVSWAQEIIERQTKQLAKLVDDLLDVSRISRGKIQLRKELLKLEDLLTRALESVSSFVEQKGHRLAVEISPESLAVEGDPTRVEQSLVNILTNAIKYTDAGGAIEVKLCREGDQGVISVRDNGIGIAPDMLPRIFDLFEQADSSLDRAQGGLGIGLTLVEQLLKLHGGSVSATSDGIGKGSQFTIRLPLVHEASCENSSVVSTGPVGPTAAELFHRILVVDDNEDTAASLCRLLCSLGFEVATAHDGREALRRAEEFKPEVVLLDIGLPLLNGYEVARVLRATLSEPAPLLLAVSGYGQEQDRLKSAEAGFDDHLIKPVDVSYLLRFLAQLKSKEGKL